MLRNGARAIALGPRQVNPFIWWCVVDQRIAMWTMLVGPITAIYAAAFAPDLLVTLFLWFILSRVILSLWLFRYARSPDLAWPFILYVNQVLNACVKVALLFRLNRQVWANRGNQKSRANRGMVDRIKVAFAWIQLVGAVGAFMLIVGSITTAI